MTSTGGGAASSCRHSTSANRRRGSCGYDRRGTAWPSAGSGQRRAAGPAICDERVLRCAASALVRLDIGDDVLNGANLLGVFVRNFDVELLFERHHQLDDIERVGAEILDERGVRSYFVRGHAQLLAYLLANLGFDVLSHRALVPPGSEPCLGRQSIFQNYPTAAKTTDDGARVGIKLSGEHKD